MKRVLVTGGSGMLGNFFSEFCSKNKIEVFHLSHSKTKLNSTRYKTFYWSPKTNEFDLKALENVDTIVHLAGATIAKRWSQNYKQEVINSRVLSTKFLYEVLKNNDNKVKHLIGASAVGYYGSEIDENKKYSENDKQGNDFLATVCDKWEDQYQKFKEIEGLKLTVLRIGMLLSSTGGALPKLVLPISYGIGAAFGSGKQAVSWIHIEDLCRLIIYCEKNKIFGTYNAVSPYDINNDELVKEIAQVLHRPLFLPAIPAMFLKLILGEMSILLLGGKKINAQKIIKTGFSFKYEKINPALKELLKRF